jgi:hypothetical protein
VADVQANGSETGKVIPPFGTHKLSRAMTHKIWFTILMLFALSLSATTRAEPLLLCGADEVFMIDTATAERGTIEKLWSWRAKDHAAELPERLRASFGATNDCKPVRGGAAVLISSSGGGCALVERPSGRVVWYALVHNAHSLELLPRERVIVASSVGEGGNRLVLFDLARSDRPVWDTPLTSAHGVVWDGARQRLWALGDKELRAYAQKDWDTARPSLDLSATHRLSDGEGHDLQAVPRSADLCLSTYRHVYLFDRDHPAAAEFRPHPEIGDRSNVKSACVHPVSGRTVFTQGSDAEWWCETVRFLGPADEVKLKGERLYKARWVVERKAADKD